MATPIRRQYQIFIDRPPQALFDFFINLRSYNRILPEDQKIVNEAETVLRDEGTLRLKWRQNGVWRNQELAIADWNPPVGFTERQISGPFATWVHRHRFHEFQTGTLMTDIIEYSLPVGPVGLLLEKLYLTPHLDVLMNHRQSEAKRVLETVTRIKGRGI